MCFHLLTDVLIKDFTIPGLCWTWRWGHGSPLELPTVCSGNDERREDSVLIQVAHSDRTAQRKSANPTCRRNAGSLFQPTKSCDWPDEGNTQAPSPQVQGEGTGDGVPADCVAGESTMAMTIDRKAGVPSAATHTLSPSEDGTRIPDSQN